MPVKITFNTKIQFNGRDYGSIDEMPPEARQAYERALDVLMMRYQPSLLRRLDQHLRNFASAEEVAQEAWMNVLRSASTGREAIQPSSGLEGHPW